ncbi:unnamed protein product [Polarella glacialis]|uniref:Uncharacterized protein n=1 Tax=Polarella glacialis TaxID=89957 RepID=A0A813KF74_POLGL|nr:unnamed protein product [Polarella glacialis]CAE8702035.1 unnamed protein product [Polarella glacialis]
MYRRGRFWPTRVPDTIQVTRRAFLQKILLVQRAGKWWPQENMWDEMSRLVGYQNMGFISPFVFADSDSGKASNPMCKMCSRLEGPLPPQNFLLKKEDVLVSLHWSGRRELRWKPSLASPGPFVSASLSFSSAGDLPQLQMGASVGRWTCARA